MMMAVTFDLCSLSFRGRLRVAVATAATFQIKIESFFAP